MSNEKPQSLVSSSMGTFLDFALPQAISFIIGAIPENLRLQKQICGNTISYWQAGKSILQNRGPWGFVYGIRYGVTKKTALSGAFGLSLIPISKEVKEYLPKELLEQNPDAHYMVAAFPASVISTTIGKVFDNPRIYETTGPKGTTAWQGLIKSNYEKSGTLGVGRALFKGFVPSVAIKTYNVIGYHALNPYLSQLAQYLNEGKALSSSESRYAGGATGCVLGVVSTPAARLVTEMVKHGSVSDTMLKAFMEILKKPGGVKNLFAGGLVHVAHAMLSGVSYSQALMNVENRDARSRTG